MPVLSNERHEAFAKNVAAGQTKYDSYINAGFTGNPTNASQLMARPEVRQRVQELIEERQAGLRAAEAEEDDSVANVDKDWIVRQLKNNVREAQTSGQISAANKAIELLMDIKGLGKKDRTKIGDPAEGAAPETARPQHFDKVIDQLERLEGAPGDDDTEDA